MDREKQRRQLIEVYNILYQEKHATHPVKGLLELYGSHDNRDRFFLNYLESRIFRRAKVLDASCGRGHLLRSLIEYGYEAFGTEVADVLFESDLKKLPVKKLAYHELRELGKESFDVVISNDVLEHLQDVEAVREGISNLCYVSRRFVLISVGVKAASKYPTAIPKVGRVLKSLHCVQRPPEWWKDMLSDFIALEQAFRAGSSWYGFGVKREL